MKKTLLCINVFLWTVLYAEENIKNVQNANASPQAKTLSSLSAATRALASHAQTLRQEQKDAPVLRDDKGIYKAEYVIARGTNGNYVICAILTDTAPSRHAVFGDEKANPNTAAHTTVAIKNEFTKVSRFAWADVIEPEAGSSYRFEQTGTRGVAIFYCRVFLTPEQFEAIYQENKSGPVH